MGYQFYPLHVGWPLGSGKGLGGSGSRISTSRSLGAFALPDLGVAGLMAECATRYIGSFVQDKTWFAWGLGKQTPHS